VSENSFVVQTDTEFMQNPSGARYLQYEWSGSELGQDWEMGIWFEDTQAGATQ